MSNLPTIDTEAIETLRALNPGDNDEFLRDITGIFLEDTPLRIAELDQSLAKADLPTFIRAAHTIKGSSSNLGALALRAVAERLEYQSRRSGLEGVANDLATLKTEFANLQVELRKLLQPA
jgi:HPt (histidine-containing phosphotransfer) domain-containing protein